jgi:hypothetical protein
MTRRSIIVKNVRLAAFAVGFTTSDTVIRKRYCATLAAVTLFFDPRSSRTPLGR